MTPELRLALIHMVQQATKTLRAVEQYAKSRTPS